VIRLSSKVNVCCGVVALLFALTAISRAADKIVWKTIPQVVLRIDDQPPKMWKIYHTEKKADPLLLELGTRMLVFYIHDQAVYEIMPEKLQRKGKDLLWSESDRPEHPLPTSDLDTRDVGSAWRIRVKLSAEGRLFDIQIPQRPDLRGLY
jgi:hypothetical protein